MMKAASILFIEVIHNLFSILTLPSCRFSPSCSSYARQAIRQYGSVRGWRLALQRLAKCHPLGPAGIDPVP